MKLDIPNNEDVETMPYLREVEELCDKCGALMSVVSAGCKECVSSNPDVETSRVRFHFVCLECGHSVVYRLAFQDLKPDHPRIRAIVSAWIAAKKAKDA